MKIAEVFRYACPYSVWSQSGGAFGVRLRRDHGSSALPLTRGKPAAMASGRRAVDDRLAKGVSPARMCRGAGAAYIVGVTTGIPAPTSGGDHTTTSTATSPTA